MWNSYLIEKMVDIKCFHSIIEMEQKAGFSFSGEIHNFWECVYIKKGNICASGDEKVYHLGENDIIFHKPMELHKYYVENNTKAELFIFSFTAEGEITKFFENKVFHLTGGNKKIIEEFIKFVNEQTIDSKTRYDILNPNLVKPLFDGLPINSHITSNYVSQLLLMLYNDKNIVVQSNDTADTYTFEKAVLFMNKNISTNLTISDIATHCNISETGLKNIFSKYSGMGVHKYFLKQKISVAIKMLQNGETVSECAEKLGFSSQGYFSYVLKRETGITPLKIKISDKQYNLM